MGGMDWQIERFPILASTNQLALDWMESGHARAGMVLVAGEQTSGRGRQGRSWSSGRGALLMTAVLPLDLGRVGWTSLAAGIAVAQALRDLGAPARVKWPNDVLLAGRKVAGILVETNRPGLAAVGIGLNVTNELPPDSQLLQPATRLREHLPHAGLEDALGAVLTRLGHWWRELESGRTDSLRQAWEELDTTAGRSVVWSEGNVQGTALGVTDDGALRLRLADGREVAARVGEIRFAEAGSR